MTDRINALTVILNRDIREDDCEAVIHAIRMIRGVGDVQTHVSDVSTAVAAMRVRADIEKRLLSVLRDTGEYLA